MRRVASSTCTVFAIYFFHDSELKIQVAKTEHVWRLTLHDKTMQNVHIPKSVHFSRLTGRTLCDPDSDPDPHPGPDPDGSDPYTVLETHSYTDRDPDLDPVSTPDLSPDPDRRWLRSKSCSRNYPFVEPHETTP